MVSCHISPLQFPINILRCGGPPFEPILSEGDRLLRRMVGLVCKSSINLRGEDE